MWACVCGCGCVSVCVRACACVRVRACVCVSVSVCGERVRECVRVGEQHVRVTAQQKQSRNARLKMQSPTWDAQINLAMYGANGVPS